MIIMPNKTIKSNLRWAGGKSKMLKILDNFFPQNVNKYLEVFTGGGSVLLYIVQKFNPSTVYANDIDTKLINFYNDVKNQPEIIVDTCLSYKNDYNAETFRERFNELDRTKSCDFFTANKCSFSGLNKNYSILAYDRNFSVKSINQTNEISKVIQNTEFLNEDFVNLDNKIDEIEDYFIYLDPPYYGNKNIGLYGEDGKLHKEFNHIALFEWVNKHSNKNKIMMSYDDCQFIRDLYKDYYIYNFDFVYSMTNTGGHDCKMGKEIVITNYKIN